MAECVTIRVVGQPEIEVTNVSASPTRVQVGQPVTITATISNNGTASGSATFDVYVNGTPQNLRKSVTLNPGQSTTLSWSLTFDSPGNYNVCVYKV